MTSLLCDNDAARPVEATERPSARSRRLLPALFVASLALGVWYGHVGLSPGRFPDEIYARESIASLLQTHSLRPISGYHPILSYLPHGVVLLAAQDLARWVGASDSLILEGHADGFTPFGYLLGRFVQALFGALSVLLTYRIGRLLYGPRAALIAALLVATAPWHVRQSGLINEDATLVFFSLVAFAWSLDAAREPRLGTFVKAGLGIGLALSTKFNAGPIALSLMAAALLRFRRDRRELAWLCAAGLVSLALFFLANPYVLIQPELYRHDFGRTLSQYHAWSKGTTRAGVLLFAATTLLSSSYLSWAAVATFFGLALLFWRLRPGSSTPEPARVEGAMLIAFLVGYPVLYSFATKNPSQHNFLQLVPFGAIVAGWVIDRGWRRATAWAGPPAARLPVGFPAAAVALVQGSLVIAYVYGGTVVRTLNRVEEDLAQRFGEPNGRIVFYEGTGIGPLVEKYPERAAVVTVDHLSAVPPPNLNAADVEVFPTARLEGDGAEFYRARLHEQPANRIARFSAQPFVTRGPELTTILHLWRPAHPGGTGDAGRAIPLRIKGNILIGELPPGPPGSWATIELSLRRPRIRRHSSPPRLALGGHPVQLLWVRTQRGIVRMATTRFRSPQAPTSFRIRLGAATASGEGAYLRWWYPPAPRTFGSWPMVTAATSEAH